MSLRYFFKICNFVILSQCSKLFPNPLQKRNMVSIPIKLIVFDLDDCIIYGEQDLSVGDNPLKFQPVGDYDPETGVDRVVDGPNRVQVLMPHVREVLEELTGLGITLTWGSMGPEWQMRRFCEGLGIAKYFDWELGSYDRRDKGEKVEMAIEHYNARLFSQYLPNDPIISEMQVKMEEVLFVDDNMGYLARVDNYLPGVKVVWAHYRLGEGLRELYLDLEEEFEIDLKSFIPSHHP